MILVVTVSDDITADYVGSRLVTRGVPFVRLNLDEVYRFGVVSIKPDQGRWVITCAEKYIESDSIDVIWQRRLPRPKLQHSNKHVEEYLNQEWRLFWKWWINQIPESRILDPEWCLNLAANKLAQLHIASKCGLRIPDTIVTSTPEDLLGFAKKHSRIVVKTLGGFGRIIEPGILSRVMYTNPVKDEDLASGKYPILQTPLSKCFR